MTLASLGVESVAKCKYSICAGKPENKHKTLRKQEPTSSKRWASQLGDQVLLGANGGVKKRPELADNIRLKKDSPPGNRPQKQGDKPAKTVLMSSSVYREGDVKEVGGNETLALHKRVLNRAYSVLQGNRVDIRDSQGRRQIFTTPSLSTGVGDSHLDYGGKQWLWDSASHAMVLADVEPEVAKSELKAVFAYQNLDPRDKDYGFVPHMNYFRGDGREVPEWAKMYLEKFLAGPEGDLIPASKRAEFVNTYWSNPNHSDITQPPILAMAVEEVYRATGDKVFLHEMLPKLSAYYDYLERRRADSDGLLQIIHSWESGWDNSQRWDEAYGLPRTAPVERSKVDERKLHLFALYKAVDWDLDRIKQLGGFLVKPVDFNVLYAVNLESLARLFREIGDKAKAEEYSKRADSVRQAVFDKMWDGDKYCDIICKPDGEKLSQVKSAAMFYPLMLDDEPHGKDLIARHLANPHEFNPEGGYSIPTTSMDDPTLDKDQYWRGNIWLIVNFFVHAGLQKYLKHHPGDLLARALDNKIRESGFEVLDKSGFCEYFNPDQEHPTGHGVPSFGWNGLVKFMDQEPAFLREG